MKNLLVHDDAVAFLQRLASTQRAIVDLAYLDPPFNVGAPFTARTSPAQRRTRGNRKAGPVAYVDSWGGIEGFLSFLESSLAAVREVMNPSSLMWLHLDHRAVHEAKVVCDRVFGTGTYRGEVIWVPGNGGRSSQGPSVTHQTLLIYSRGSGSKAVFAWNAEDPTLREPYAATSLSMHFKNVDEAGRRYRERTIGAKTYRYYADQGRKLGSVWTDLPAMKANTPIHEEGTGYPTQKPESLLSRIVRLSSNAGAVVCDPMCGSGTTLVVAGKLGRTFIGCDESALAYELASRRLTNAGLVFDRSLADGAEVIGARPTSPRERSSTTP